MKTGETDKLAGVDVELLVIDEVSKVNVTAVPQIDGDTNIDRDLRFLFRDWFTLAEAIQIRCESLGFSFCSRRNPLRMLRELSLGIAHGRIEKYDGREIQVTISDTTQALTQLLEGASRST